ncbi:MAG: protecting protein DprA [Paenibacillus sp.]|jgi:DNA processing protein|nr:protecting protein DprA [Paenibacillus sp.]
MDNRTILFALHEMPGIGWRTIQKLVSRYSSLSQLFNVSLQQLAALEIKPDKAERIISLLNDNDFIEQRRDSYHSRGIVLMSRYDNDYPEWLSQIAQPPWILYLKGNVSLLQRPCIAMVGTRTPTAYGKKVAYQFAQQLADAGMTVVSGLARGIDSEAHRGALRAEHGGSTIGVLGCALDTVYPPENASLYTQLAEHGLLVSEFPLGTPVHPGLFPQRNRIIAGLSLGTIVVEAADRSGSLITADQALEYSRDVFAVPGPITSPKSAGTLSLIKQGAKTVTCIEDVLEEYSSLLTLHPVTAVNVHSNNPVQLSEQETELLQYISWEPITLDQLLTRSGFAFGQMHTVLLSLTMLKQIQQLPGSTFVRL